jgi:hypothetical protein
MYYQLTVQRNGAAPLTAQAYAADVANVHYISVTEAGCTEVNTTGAWNY